MNTIESLSRLACGRLIFASVMLRLIFLPAGQAVAQSAAELVQKNIAAKGGYARLKALNTIKRTGTITLVSSGLVFQFTSYHKRPDKIRVESSFAGKKMVEAFDGRTPWSINPLMGSRQPQRIPAADAMSLVEQAAFDHPFIDYAENGRTIELQGSKILDGMKTYKLKLTRATGEVDYYYLDARTFLEHRVVSVRTVLGKRIETTTIYGAYRTTQGVTAAHALEVRGLQHAKSTIDAIVYDQPLDDAMFVMPAK